jgi:stage IV sporulation protein FB
VFLEPRPTAFDLRWRMFGIPVRVHPGFWIFTGILGYGWLDIGFSFFLLWIACSFVSILFHELGHVVMARWCGQPAHIVLHTFGGLAIGNYAYLKAWQRIAIYAAGPGAGFLLYGLVELFREYALWKIDPTANMPYLHFAVRMLLIMNLFWNVLNLIPVFPLDGGQIMKEMCVIISKRNGFRFALGLSLLIAGLFAVYSLIVKNRPELPYPPRLDPTFNFIFFAFMAFQNFTLMRAVEREQRRWEYDEDFD